MTPRSTSSTLARLVDEAAAELGENGSIEPTTLGSFVNDGSVEATYFVKACSMVDALLLEGDKLHQEQERLKQENEDLLCSLPCLDNRDDNAVRSDLGTVYRLKIGPNGDYPEVGVVEVLRASEALKSQRGHRNAALIALATERTLREANEKLVARLQSELNGIASYGTVYTFPNNWDFAGMGGGPSIDSYEKLDLVERARSVLELTAADFLLLDTQAEENS